MAAPLPPKSSEEQHHRIAHLVHRYLQKRITRLEHDELDAWAEASDDHILLFEALTDPSFLEALAINRQLVETFIARYSSKG